MTAHADHPTRTYHVLGVPLRTGSLYPGNENDAQAYRDADLLGRLQSTGCQARDEGDLAIPSYLPHHTIPPIRSWPGPRIVWDAVSERLAPLLNEPGHVPLLVGCDCSIVVGTTQALRQVAPDDLHLLYVDGDFDDAQPDPTRCQSAAMLAVWLLTHHSPFWAGPPLAASQVTVIGASTASQSERAAMPSLSLAEVRRAGPRLAARQVLEALPPSAVLLLHLDVDVLSEQALPAAYFPHPEGLSWSEAQALLGELLGDPRLRLVEISEYAALRDQGRACARKLVGLLAERLRP
jgi:arginase